MKNCITGYGVLTLAVLLCLPTAGIADEVRYNFVAKLDQPMGSLDAGHIITGTFAYEQNQPLPPGNGTSTYPANLLTVTAGDPHAYPGLETLTADLANLSINDNGAFLPPADTFGAAGSNAGSNLGTLGGVVAQTMRVLFRDTTTTVFNNQLPPGPGLTVADFPSLAVFEIREAVTGTNYVATVVRLEIEPVLSLVADRNTAIPSGSGNFTTFFFTGATVDGENVAFKARGNNSQQGVYALIDGSLSKLADRNTRLPGFSANFYNVGAPYINGKSVAFHGGGGTGGTGFGIYAKTPTTFSQVVGSGGTGFNSPRFEADTVAYIDRCSGLRAVCLASNGSVTVVANSSTQIPNTADNFATFSSLSFDGMTAAFTGRDGNGFEGVFTGNGGSVSEVVVTGDVMPSQPVPFEFFGETDIAAGSVAFIGSGGITGNTRPKGVYTVAAGSLAVVADTSTNIPSPVIASTFRNFQSVALVNGKTMFKGSGFAQVGSSFFSLDGLFLDDGSGLRTLIDNFTMIGGERVTGIGFIGEGYDGASAALVVVTPTQSGVYRMPLEPVDTTLPTADAGVNQSIHAGQFVQFDGSGSFDDSTLSVNLAYTWSLTSQPLGSSAVLQGANTVMPSLATDVPGTFVVGLVVADEAGNVSAADGVEVSSNNVSPEANAGVDQIVIVGASVVLDGVGTDADFDTLTYSWQLETTPTSSTALLSSSSTAQSGFIADLEGAYVVGLVVNDGFADSAADSVTISAIASGEFAQMELMDANDVVNQIPDETLSSPGHSQSMTNDLSIVVNFIQNDQVAQALKQLGKLIERTDGCALRGAPDSAGQGSNSNAADWVTDCAEQIPLYEELKNAEAALLGDD